LFPFALILFTFSMAAADSTSDVSSSFLYNIYNKYHVLLVYIIDPGRSFRPSETAIKWLNSGRNGEKRWPFLAVFHRFRAVIRHPRFVYTVSPKRKTAPFHAVTVEKRRVVLIPFSLRLVPETHLLTPFTATFTSS